jgi:DNA-binding Lrp family transcriptional regulator
MKQVRALVLIEATSSQAKRIRDAIMTCSNGSGCKVESADPLTGQFDFAVNVEAPSFDAITKFVTNEVQAVDGVGKTHTHLKINVDD